MSNNKVFVSKLNLQAIWAEIKTALDSKADADSLSTYVAQCSDILSQVQTAGSDATTKIANLLGAQDYDSTSTYAEGAYCFYNSNFYRCSTAISTPESWNASHWTQVSITSESARIITEIQAEGATQVAAVQSVYAEDLAEINARVSRNTKAIANLVQKEGVVSISYPDSVYGRGEVPSGMAKFAEVKTLRGVTRVGNQLINPTYKPSTTNNGVTFTNNGDGSWTVNGTAGTGGSYVILYSSASVISTHVYLIMDDVSDSTWGLCANLEVSTKNSIKASKSSPNITLFVPEGKVLSSVTISPWFTDLTLYFGGTIPSDAQTIADIQQNYPELLVPSDYDAGSLVDITYSAVESVGVNLWDEEWEVGDYSNSGVKIHGEGIRSADKIKVSEHETYFLIGGITWWICEYDANETFITRRAVSAGNNYIPTSGTHYIAFNTASAYGGVYNHDLQICYSSLDISIKSTYHPYMKSTLTLPSPVTLPSAGSVADTDELCVEVSEGVFKRRKTKRVGSYTFTGNETPTSSYQRTNGDWYCVFQSIFNGGKDGGEGLSDKGIPFTTGNIAYDGTGSYFVTRGSGGLAFYLAGATSASAVMAWISANLPKVQYELADPIVTLADPIPDNFVLTEAGGTITPRQTQTHKIDTSFDIEYLAL